MAIDWAGLAIQLGNLTGDREIYSTETGQRALELLLGEDNIRETVDYWISQQPGCFTAEMVLNIIQSKIAMERCYEIYKGTRDPEKACGAVFLLAGFAEQEALPWVREFLHDHNRSIRWNGLMVLGRILAGPMGDAAIATAKELLDVAASDPDPELRERAIAMRMKEREFDATG